MRLLNAEIAATKLMLQHGLTSQGWSFHWAKGKRTFGTCVYDRKQIRLSRHLTLLNEEEEVRDTVLHELAHALMPGHGHGRAWKAKCREIGARPERCYRAAHRGGTVVMPDEIVNRTHNFETRCVTCSAVTAKNFRRRKASTLARRRCGICGGRTLQQFEV